METQILISNQMEIQKLGGTDSSGRQFKQMGMGDSAEMMDPMIISTKCAFIAGECSTGLGGVQLY